MNTYIILYTCGTERVYAKTIKSSELNEALSDFYRQREIMVRDNIDLIEVKLVR